MEIRDAVADDAPAACQVLRRSISALCIADHRNDPTILVRWLSNKTPQFIDLNREALMDLWEGRIDSGELGDRLKPIAFR